MGKSKTIGKPDYFNFGKYAVGGIGFSMTNQFILVYHLLRWNDMCRS